MSDQLAIAKELRKLVSDIEKLVSSNPCSSVVMKPTQVLCDHISAMARIRELNAEQER